MAEKIISMYVEYEILIKYFAQVAAFIYHLIQKNIIF